MSSILRAAPQHTAKVAAEVLRAIALEYLRDGRDAIAIADLVELADRLEGKL